MPPAVFSSASRRLTTILSFKGTTFMPFELLGGNTLPGCRLPAIARGAAVDPDQGANHGVQKHVLADRLGDHAVGPGPERLPQHDLVGVRRHEDARQDR